MFSRTTNSGNRRANAGRAGGTATGSVRSRRYKAPTSRTPAHSAKGRGRARNASSRTGTHSRRQTSYGSSRRASLEPKTPVQADNAPKRRYITPLDGLRAFAVLAVIAYHLDVPWMPSGLLGVTVFFVLSGYLITGLLVDERESFGRIDLPHFWLRRVRRLFPAVVTVIIVVLLLTVLLNHVLLTKMRPDILPSLTFCMNWWYIFHDVSYFDALGSPSPLMHFWSLAIEEQFYLVWPLAIIGIYKLGGGKRTVRRVCLALAIASTIAMAVLYSPEADPSRVYYGTDTRAFSLLIGGWLAIFWNGNSLCDKDTVRGSLYTARRLDIAGLVCLAGIIVVMATVDDYSGFLYYGGIALVSVLTAVCIASLAHPLTIISRVFSWRPLVWIGKRSYGMYLWHYPIILLFGPAMQKAGGYTWWLCLIIVGIVFGVSALSYTFIENPIRHGAIGRAVAKIRNGETSVLEMLRRKMLPTALVGAVALVSVVGCAVVPDTSVVPQEAIVSTGVSASEAMDVSAVKDVSSDSTDGDATQDGSGGEPTHQEGVYNPLMIGDSVPGDSYDNFSYYFPNGLLDAYIGRWEWQVQEVYQGYLDQGVVGKVVIVHCFSNHAVIEDEVEEMVNYIGPEKEIFLVNIFRRDSVGDTEMDEWNAILQAVADRHDNVHIIDWHGVCYDHAEEYLWGDLLHLRPEGSEVYMRMIRDAVAPYLASEDVVLD